MKATAFPWHALQVAVAPECEAPHFSQLAIWFPPDFVFFDPANRT
jgi:hypothetical protein